MKKYIVYIMLLGLTISSLFAQEDRERGFYLGADRDTLEYIVASPFDNWYLSVGAGIQNFIGNETADTARWNTPDFKVYFQVGKWLIPDVAVSLWVSYYTLTSQTKYSRHPYLNYEYYRDHQNEYQRFTANAVSIGGLVTLDWTNLLNGYEKGLQRKWHFMTPVGLGLGVNWDYQINTHIKDFPVGKIRRNFELYYTIAFLAQYSITDKIKLDLSARYAAARGSYDSYHDNTGRPVNQDFMPSITAGVRFNLLKTVNKIDARTGRRISDATVYHEFQPANQERVHSLTVMLDSLRALLNSAKAMNIANTDALSRQIDSLNDLLNQEKLELNPMAQIDIAATQLELPMARVYFQLDKYDLDYNARKILHNFAIQIKNDTTSRKYYIIGAADAQTGSVEHNQKLSENRCLSVYKVLVNGYGIPKDKLVYYPLGGITEYEPQEYNRTCIMVQSDSKLTEIIYKWTFDNN